jgi:hypothetical protein
MCRGGTDDRLPVEQGLSCAAAAHGRLTDWSGGADVGRSHSLDTHPLLKITTPRTAPRFPDISLPIPSPKMHLDGVPTWRKARPTAPVPDDQWQGPSPIDQREAAVEREEAQETQQETTLPSPPVHQSRGCATSTRSTWTNYCLPWTSSLGKMCGWILTRLIVQNPRRR